MWYNFVMLKPKIKMKTRFVTNFFTVIFSFILLSFLSGVGTESFSSSANEQVYPYTKTFTISAYYSPLPCQMRYATGSYTGDIRLNGSGVRSADGTPVYPGMIAAPRNYPYGTKMDIPGVGIVSVHDRGGAIVASDQEGVFDRLDVWMGYGDKGLTRALNWGKRNLNVVVYGKDDSIKEKVFLSGYSPSEAIPNQCESTEPVKAPTPVTENPVDSGVVHEAQRLTKDLKIGDRGDQVLELQRELTRLNYFRTSITGYYGPVTEHAVFKFQQSQRLVGDKSSLGAGIFGPKTRDALNRVIVARGYKTRMVAEATENHGQRLVASIDKNELESANIAVAGAGTQSSSSFVSNILTKELNPGQRDNEVETLQRVLRDKGFFEGMLITDYFGPVTKDAVLRFQLANNIVNSENDSGAGRVGPATLALLNG